MDLDRLSMSAGEAAHQGRGVREPQRQEHPDTITASNYTQSWASYHHADSSQTSGSASGLVSQSDSSLKHFRPSRQRGEVLHSESVPGSTSSGLKAAAPRRFGGIKPDDIHLISRELHKLQVQRKRECNDFIHKYEFLQGHKMKPPHRLPALKKATVTEPSEYQVKTTDCVQGAVQQLNYSKPVDYETLAIASVEQHNKPPAFDLNSSHFHQIESKPNLIVCHKNDGHLLDQMTMPQKLDVLQYSQMQTDSFIYSKGSDDPRFNVAPSQHMNYGGNQRPNLVVCRQSMGHRLDEVALLRKLELLQRQRQISPVVRRRCTKPNVNDAAKHLALIQHSGSTSRADSLSTTTSCSHSPASTGSRTNSRRNSFNDSGIESGVHSERSFSEDRDGEACVHSNSKGELVAPGSGKKTHRRLPKYEGMSEEISIEVPCAFGNAVETCGDDDVFLTVPTTCTPRVTTLHSADEGVSSGLNIPEIRMISATPLPQLPSDK